MKKIKNNKVIDLKNESEHEKVIKLGEISKEINSIFRENIYKTWKLGVDLQWSITFIVLIKNDNLKL